MVRTNFDEMMRKIIFAFYQTNMPN